jgi:hypothetical protein
VLSWSPRSDLMERGYQGKTVRLWPSDRTPPQQSEPTRAEWEVISAWCVRYHAEQLLWARGGVEDDPRSLFDGMIGSLIIVYQKHKNSPFKRVRFETQETYTKRLHALTAAIGKVRVTHVTFDDITNWQNEFADPGDGGKPMKARGRQSHFSIEAGVSVRGARAAKVGRLSRRKRHLQQDARSKDDEGQQQAPEGIHDRVAMPAVAA